MLRFFAPSPSSICVATTTPAPVLPTGALLGTGHQRERAAQEV